MAAAPPFFRSADDAGTAFNVEVRPFAAPPAAPGESFPEEDEEDEDDEDGSFALMALP